MDQQPEEKKNGKAKAHAVAGWEWFKQAAWLQVLLIVGVVVGVITAIPFAVKGISNAIADNTSGFYKARSITYAQLSDYRDGKDTKCNGAVGKGENVYGLSEDQEGFCVMFYKDNCDNCNSMQKGIEEWYNDFNKKYSGGRLKLYTINVAWRPDSETDSKKYEGSDPAVNYKNTKITLAEQYQVQQDVKAVYDKQDDTHKSSSVTDDTLDKRLDTQTGGGTLPTPAFVTYTKAKTANTYVANQPAKVIFGMEGSLSTSSYSDIAREMNDIFNFQLYTK